MTRSSLRVLAYHRVMEPDSRSVPNPSLVSATPAVFERQVEHLMARYRIVSLMDVLTAQRGEHPLPPRAVLLTFDDASRDFGDIVWPVLKRHGVSATVFVPTAYPGDPARVFWWERVHHAVEKTECQFLTIPELGTLHLDSREARRLTLLRIQHCIKRLPHARAMALVDRICSDLHVEEIRNSSVLGWPELRRLAADGVCLAAHTRNHPALTRVSSDVLGEEIRGSLDDLKRETGTVLPAFCCPFGLYDDKAVDEMKRQGVEVAFTCQDGHNQLPSTDPLRLRRTMIMSRTSPFIFRLRLLKVVSYIDMWRHRTKPGDCTPVHDSGMHSPRGDAPMKVAYIMSRFPKLSETFVLNEILALESRGIDIEIYPLLRARQAVSHPEAARLTARARFLPFVSIAIVRAQLHFIRKEPGAYFRVLGEALRETFGSFNFFVGAIGIFPKCVRFAYEMQRSGVTHIHAHFCSHPAAAALIIHRLTGIPFSFTAHGSDLHVERRMLAAKLKAATFAVTICEFNRNVMIEECGEQLRSRIHVIHCGVDPEHFVPGTGRLDGDPFQIICVASLEEVKGHRYLIDACRIMKQDGVDFRCHLVGAGPLRRVLEALIHRSGLSDHVFLQGGQPRSEVARLLAGADVAVLASHPTREGKREGLPVALMEAMAAGLPVVASGISGIPELVEPEVTGLLVQSGDPHAIADALKRLSADGELRYRMGVAGRQRIREEFALDANVDELLDLLVRAGTRGEADAPRRERPLLQYAQT